MAVDPAGNGIALWRQIHPGPRWVRTSVYSAAAQAWGTLQSVRPTRISLATYTEVAMDPRGHAHALWGTLDNEDRVSLMTNRRVAPGGFGVPITYNNISATLAVNAQGKAVMIRAVWVDLGEEGCTDLDAVFFE